MFSFPQFSGDKTGLSEGSRIKKKTTCELSLLSGVPEIPILRVVQACGSASTSGETPDVFMKICGG